MDYAAAMIALIFLIDPNFLGDRIGRVLFHIKVGKYLAGQKYQAQLDKAALKKKG